MLHCKRWYPYKQLEYHIFNDKLTSTPKFSNEEKLFILHHNLQRKLLLMYAIIELQESTLNWIIKTAKVISLNSRMNLEKNHKLNYEIKDKKISEFNLIPDFFHISAACFPKTVKRNFFYKNHDNLFENTHKK
jgi:hypothetical protein